MTVICKECNKKYKTYTTWYVHNKKCHNSPVVIKENICEYCNKTFSRQSNCSRHRSNCKEKNSKVLERVEELEQKINKMATTNTVQYNTINVQNNYINCSLKLEPIHNNKHMHKKISYEDYKNYIYDNDNENMLQNLSLYIYTTNKVDEYKNLYIPNNNSNIIYTYNDNTRCFTECDKDKTMNTYTMSNMTCVNNLVEQYDTNEKTNSVEEKYSDICSSKREMNRISNDSSSIIHMACKNVKAICNEYIKIDNKLNEENTNTIIKKKKKTVEKREQIEEEDI